MKGKVYLVGAGPGDPDLMTLRAARALGQADIILVDELVDPRCLVHANFHSRIVKVGKRGGCKSTPQAFIERLMVRLARRGKVVVRLKGGHPFMFGRGGEEVLMLKENAIPFEVIPGITAGLATGIPVTYRGISSGVSFLSGHTDNHDWSALRAGGTTLVIYMGLARLPELVAGMLAGGFHASTPACVVQDETLPTRREVMATLASLPSLSSELRPPALIIVGEVVRFAGAESGNVRRTAA
jgi:uroporphyrin-III C-methyltransferase